MIDLLLYALIILVVVKTGLWVPIVIVLGVAGVLWLFVLWARWDAGQIPRPHGGAGGSTSRGLLGSPTAVSHTAGYGHGWRGAIDVPPITATRAAPRIPSPTAGRSARTPRRKKLQQESLSSALIIRPEPLGKILAGRKTWEMRSTGTTKRGTIGLIEKGSGTIVGVADLVDCRGPLSEDDMRAAVDCHQIEAHRLASGETAKWRTAWVLTNVRRLKRPVPYVHKPGAVTWVSLDAPTAEAVRSSI